MEIKELEQIIAILKQNDVVDFELDREGCHIKLSRSAHRGATQTLREVGLEPAIVTSSNVAMPEAKPVSDTENLVKVESPLVGTFYRKPSPDAEPFVKEGDTVKKGDTLCIVEAMKLMNEIDAGCDGRIEKVLINDGQVVEYGEVLFLINPKI